jgi:hypothetical protein
MGKAAGVGVALVAISFPLHPLAELLYPVYDYWHVSPSFFLLRLGLVLLICSGLFLYEQRVGIRAWSVVTLFGRESLIVYVTHLTILYGAFSGPTIAQRFGGLLGYGEAILATLVLFGLMYVLAYVWGRIKRGNLKAKYAVEGGFVMFLAYFFFFGLPW